MILRPKYLVDTEDFTKIPINMKGKKYARLLFKPKYLETILISISDLTLNFSINSATAILLIWDSINRKFYDIDLDNLLNKIEENLCNKEFKESIKFNLSNSCGKVSNSV